MGWHRFDNVGVCNGNDDACVCVFIDGKKSSDWLKMQMNISHQIKDKTILTIIWIVFERNLIFYMENHKMFNAIKIVYWIKKIIQGHVVEENGADNSYRFKHVRTNQNDNWNGYCCCWQQIWKKPCKWGNNAARQNKRLKKLRQMITLTAQQMSVVRARRTIVSMYFAIQSMKHFNILYTHLFIHYQWWYFNFWQTENWFFFFLKIMFWFWYLRIKFGNFILFHLTIWFYCASTLIWFIDTIFS